MDAQAKRKASFRAKLSAQQEKQRIDSPIIRYDEHDQPVCRVCDVVIKSVSLWPAHQASRKHHEAISKLKANAAAVNGVSNSKTKLGQELQNSKPESHGELRANSKPSTVLPKVRPSMPPPDFFDKQDSKRQKNERDLEQLKDPESYEKEPLSAKARVLESSASGSGTERASIAKYATEENPGFQAAETFRQVSRIANDLEGKQAKGALPEGFFDDKDSDLRARGIEPVKPDVKDEYKEFEKLIQEDLQGIDDRLEEEEYDAAEMIEEEESVEQRSCRERVEAWRRKKLELKASMSAVPSKETKTSHKDSIHIHTDSSSDDENYDNIAVDWRAKRL